MRKNSLSPQLCLFIVALCSPVRAGSDGHQPVLTDESAQRQYLALLENFAGWAEQHWNEKDKAYDAKGRGVSWARGNGNVCMGYAVLLTERPEQEHFSKHRIPRGQMLERVRRTLLTLCLTNRNCADRDRAKQSRWGGPSWQSGLETSAWAWAARLLDDQLDDATRALVRQVVTAEADNIKKQIPSRVHNDTGSEDGVWNTALAGLATNFYPDDPRAKAWDEWAKRWALNALSRQPDRDNRQMVDGVALCEWLVSVNVHPDLTLENHGFWSIPYQADFPGFAEAELAYRVTGNPVPAAYGLHAGALWEDILSWLVLPDGDLLCPQGQDWAERDIQHVWCYAWLATCHDIDAARVSEQRALQLLLRRQRAFGDGSLHAYDFGYQTHQFKRWAFAYLMHKHFGKQGPAITRLDRIGKVGWRVFPYVQTAVGRTPEIVTSISWDEKRQAVVVAPNDAKYLGEDPIFTSYHPLSGLGWVQVAGKKKVETRYQIPDPPIIARTEQALTVSFVRQVPDLVRQRIAYAALRDGSVVVYSRWDALGDAELCEVVSHPFFWVRIDGFVPVRKPVRKPTGVWTIGDRLTMQVFGGLGSVVRPGALLGSARMKVHRVKTGQRLDESLCLYRAQTCETGPGPVAGTPRGVRVGGTTVTIDDTGTIAIGPPGTIRTDPQATNANPGGR